MLDPLRKGQSTRANPKPAARRNIITKRFLIVIYQLYFLLESQDLDLPVKKHRITCENLIEVAIVHKFTINVCKKRS